MRVNRFLDAPHTDPTNQILSTGRVLSLEVHDASRAKHHIDSWTNRATCHASRLMDLYLCLKVLVCDQIPNRFEKRRTIIYPELGFTGT